MKQLYVILVLASIGPFNSFSQNLWINEVLSSNKGIAKDKFGNADDYIEIYNSSPSTINLSGYFLSDDKDSLKKWRFPQGTSIKAKGFVIVWADNETKEPGLHANFKLSSKGESIRLSNPKGIVIHKLKLKRQYGNVSFGLYPSGKGEGQYMNPSMGARNTNTPGVGFDNKKKKEKIKIKVNSDRKGFIVSNNTEGVVKAILRNKEDQVLLRQTISEKSDMISLDDIPKGKYELQIGKNLYRIVKY